MHKHGVLTDFFCKNVKVTNLTLVAFLRYHDRNLFCLIQNLMNCLGTEIRLFE